MRRIGMTVVAMVLVVAGALPATAAKPVAYDEITATVDGSEGALTLTATAIDGVGTVTLSGSAMVDVWCSFASSPVLVDWSGVGTMDAVFDLHPNGSSGTITVADTGVQATDCYGTPIGGTTSLTFTFDTDPGADRWRDADGRVVSRTGTGTLTFGVLDAAPVTVEATRSYR